jgi:translation initiation factor IF-2
MGMMGRVKLHELAKEFAVDVQQLIDVVQRLGIDVKGSMSLLGSEEARAVREHYAKLRALSRTGTASGKASVTEKRVGATVIRRRAASDKTAPPAPAEPARTAPEPEPTPDEAVASSAEETASAGETATSEEMATAADASETAGAETADTEPTSEAASAAPAATPGEAPSRSTATTPTAARPAAPAAPAKPRRLYPSIIKRVSTDQHLGEVVGPKVERKERPKTTTPAPGAPRPTRPGTAPGTAATGTGGFRRGVKEIELGPAAPTSDSAKEAAKRRGAPGRQEGGGSFRSTDYLKRELIHATKKKKTSTRPAMKTQITTAAAHKRVVPMGETISVSELAQAMGVKAAAVVGKLFGMGVSATINQSIDVDTATLVAQEYGFEVKQDVFREEEVLAPVAMDPEKLQARPPVVTIMGHVDHGKTSLLDKIRKANVAAGEAGGITQHVGAYTVQVPKGSITFVDTPGHEAFTAMRARGAKVTDIVILVVSVVDGVMPQTVESISHSKAASVPIIVALNKIDLPDANPDRVKQTLAGHGLTPEEWGGDTIFIPVSAKTGQNLDKLLEAILLQAEMLELKANYETAARGVVVESKLDKFRGAVATLLVQHGKLSNGDLVVCGTVSGKVRAMTDTFGKRLTEALPSQPVEILGLPEVPTTGDEFVVVADERVAKEVTEARLAKVRAKATEVRPKMSLEQMMAGPGTEKELRVILKSDVQGSTEAIREAMSKLPSDKAKVKVLHAATGGITESDIMLASASKAVVLGFNVRPDIKAQKLAEAEGVELRTYGIIYDMLEDLRRLLEGLLDSTIKERVIGRAEVREVFSVPKVGTIAGSAVIDGKVVRGCYLRLLRDSRVIYEGRISSLRRFKEDVKEVVQGFECGIGLENFNDLKLGDQLEAFLKEEIRGVL